MLPPFKNEPVSLFTSHEEIEQMKSAIAEARKNLGREYEIIIGGKRIKSNKKLDSINPSKPAEVVGRVYLATPELADKAVESAFDTFQKSWRNFTAEARTGILIKAAEIMRKRKFELAAWVITEIGKSWVEAVAEVSEAIDFLEFYGRAMLGYSGVQPVEPYKGEENEFYWLPLGVVVVIPPWNFPCAILTGMTSAAIVTGNTVVLKPASITPVIAYKVVEIFEQAGLPPGVLNFTPGNGGEIGDRLVTHPKTRMVAFTGSKDVGLRITELAAKVQKGQIWIKRVIAEMGGKDAIVVDETANLEDAAAEIVASAFGFQGQKCSACSRVIAVESVYENLLKMVKEQTEKLKIGDVREYGNQMGPVASEYAYNSIMRYIELGKKEGKLVLGGGRALDAGYFIKPTIFKDVSPNAVIAQEEIFGPVLAFIKAATFEQAMEIANNTVYGLTGAVFSSVRERLEYARREFFVGNLYLNRRCTGALVGVQPFGGFNMSGTDSKAG
ncbi:MAG: L-glutamate gamma-semialdehyde dehydrogenase, partial [Phycisphaerae bacterium]|nr:L-glutamate gamma-semialdehyde dehydrogenase [Phycisphaerae bacterium]